jgi:hypothetical protein
MGLLPPSGIPRPPPPSSTTPPSRLSHPRQMGLFAPVDEEEEEEDQDKNPTTCCVFDGGLELRRPAPEAQEQQEKPVNAAVTNGP